MAIIVCTPIVGAYPPSLPRALGKGQFFADHRVHGDLVGNAVEIAGGGNRDGLICVPLLGLSYSLQQKR